MTSYSQPATEAPDDTTDAETRGPHTDGRSRTSGSSWPSILSAALALGGLALASLPVLLPQYGWITQSCAQYGLTSAPLVLSGCVLFGVARMLRAVRSGLQHPAQPSPRLDPLQEPDQSARERILEQLAGELAQMRGSLQELRVEFVYLKDAQQTLLQLTAESSSELEGDVQQTAIFRLAASLDQVGARIEQRLKTQHAAMQTALEELNRGLHAAQAHLASRNGQSESRPHISLQPSSAESYAIPGPGSRARERDRQDQEEGEVDVWVELEEPAPTGSLGLLDTLGDAADTPPAKTSPSIRPAIGREKPRGNFTDATPEPAAPLPRARPTHDRPNEAVGASDADQAAEEDPIEGKLALLRSLLADSRVRQALESMRRS